MMPVICVDASESHDISLLCKRDRDRDRDREGVRKKERKKEREREMGCRYE
jgi:hypothetical protein